MKNSELGYTKNLGAVDFQKSVEKVTDALKKEGFGVLTEIDVKGTLKKKLDVDFRRYKILGACNPPFAHRALSNDPMVGLLLPCNVITYEEDDGTVTVSVANPKQMFKIVDNKDLASLAEEVDAKLKNAFNAI